LFARPANILVLDEPTNDLDIETLELLESLLADYQGTLFLVSHDRAFLDNVVTQVIAADGDGVWKEYVGGYAEWVQQRPSVKPVGATPTAPAASRNAATGITLKATTRPVKLSYKEQRELDQLPARIAALETEQAALESTLADPATYQSGTANVAALSARREAIETELLDLLERWETLEQHPR
jgi:ATP-binding cassette subfamily F protein uup